MRKEQIKNLGDADIYFVQEGAVGFFDSFFPKRHHTDQDQIFKRHYFKEGSRHLGYYMPTFENAGPSHSVKSYLNDHDHWLQHPNLTTLAENLRDHEQAQH